MSSISTQISSTRLRSLALPALVVLLFLADISLGAVSIPFAELGNLIVGKADPVLEKIFWQFRLPKAITACAAGAALALSGLQMQTFFRNPLAGPFVLGISAGASLGVALLMLGGSLLLVMVPGPWLTALAATAGSLLVFMLIVAAAVRMRQSATLLILGLMVASLAGAFVSILQFGSSAQQLQAYMLWSFGSLSSVTWQELQVLAPLVMLGCLATVWLIKPLNSLLLGELYAQSMGLSVNRTRIFILITTSLLAGSVTAFCGPIAFVGLAVPHLVRLWLQTTDHRQLVPAVMLGGMALLLICDMLTLMPGQGQLLPLNAVTSLVGAPVVIWLLFRSQTRSLFV